MGEKEGNPLFTLNELIQLQVTFACWSEMLDIFPFKGELHHFQVLHSSFAPALMFHRVHSLSRMFQPSPPRSPRGRTPRTAPRMGLSFEIALHVGTGRSEPHRVYTPEKGILMHTVHSSNACIVCKAPQKAFAVQQWR